MELALFLTILVGGGTLMYAVDRYEKNEILKDLNGKR